MTDLSAGVSEFDAKLGEAAAALDAFARGPAKRAADEVATSFERAGERIARALGRAATGGENAFRQMAKVILEELARIALDRLLGAKAGGSPNVVGERGPEMFAPPGALMPPSSGVVSIHFHLGAGADANAIARHQGQIAAAVARAVAYGRRNL